MQFVGGKQLQEQKRIHLIQMTPEMRCKTHLGMETKTNLLRLSYIVVIVCSPLIISNAFADFILRNYCVSFTKNLLQKRYVTTS